MNYPSFIFSKGESVKNSNNSEIDSTLLMTLLKAFTFKITVLVGYPSKNLIRFILPSPSISPLITLALNANTPVLSLAFGVWIILDNLVSTTFPISEYKSLLAIDIGISKSLFKIDRI